MAPGCRSPTTVSTPSASLTASTRPASNPKSACSPPSCTAYSPGSNVRSAAARASCSRSSKSSSARISIRAMSSAVTIGRSPQLGADAHALDAELLRQRLRARGDLAPQLGRLEQDCLAARSEDLALEPLVVAVRPLQERGPVLEQLGAALDREPRDILRVEDPCRPGVAQLRGLEARARLETLLRECCAPHPVEPERPLAVAGPVPRVDVPVRQLPAKRVGLDEPRGRLGVDLLLVLDLHELSFAHAAGEPRDEVGLLGRHVRLRRARELELAERLL